MRYSSSLIILLFFLYSVIYSFPIKIKSYSEIRWGDGIRQKYDNSCGLASISSLLALYKIKISEDSLWNVAKVELVSRGINVQKRYEYSMLDLVYVSKRIGYNVKGYKIDYSNLLLLKKPFIAYLDKGNGGHFTVVLSVKKNSVSVFDSTQGYMIIPKNYFISLFSPNETEGKILIFDIVDSLGVNIFPITEISLPNSR